MQLLNELPDFSNRFPFVLLEKKIQDGKRIEDVFFLLWQLISKTESVQCSIEFNRLVSAIWLVRLGLPDSERIQNTDSGTGHQEQAICADQLRPANKQLTRLVVKRTKIGDYPSPTGIHRREVERETGG